MAGEPVAAACDASVVKPDWPRLMVTVTGIRRVLGNVTLTVYGAERARFLAPHGALVVTRVPVRGPTAQGCIAVSSPGTYAIAAYHDANDNHRLDRDFLGLPTEGFGFSNDAPTLLGPPAFDAARLSLAPGAQAISIRLRYLLP